MAEIPLASYIGHIFLEIIKAREMADEYSKQVALRYASDDVLKHFSTPRFKASNIDLTIPVLISNASYTELIEFVMQREELAEYLRRDCVDLASMLGKEKDVKFLPDKMIKEIFEFLVHTAKDINREKQIGIIGKLYGQWLGHFLEQNDLVSIYREKDPKEEMAKQKGAQFTDWFRSKVKISSSKIDSLLVNPETKIVKDGSSDASVFIVSAKMIEDGFFVHSVTDENGKTQTIVEHD